ncbi:polysialyltransferase family glycosyltransferase [Propionispora hippei]|uniref:Glycosyltransferase family 52 n=1 Tax=Propionispora hippei DSM 15287 TaxID=1123003 RepID=A0A1M6K3X7_9FIRM|nr:polysialyltransferase family glycosyltransferase [Propionispora hippei]SHJ53638.1 hypothetical protein SAMN02745170_02765 [Propionispora hippei DSM 15287]
MKNKNLFIVNTPFHLLTSFILAQGRFNGDDNYLALIHPHGYEKWQDNPIMRHMSSAAGGWQQVFPLGNWLSSRHKTTSYKAQVAEVRASIGILRINTVFLGSDIDVQNQLLVGALDIDNFCRYEDGLYSYYNEDRRRSLARSFFHQTKIALLKTMAGITGKVNINTSTAGDNQSGTCDFMYKPELLQRFSPCAYKIEQEWIAKALEQLSRQKLLVPTIEGNSFLYLSQPLVEQKKFTLLEETAVLQEILRNVKTKGRLLYKPHPNDSSYKINYYRKTLPDMVIYNSIEPVELTFAYEKKIQAIISYQSSALLFPDKFARQPVKAISLVKFYKEPLHPAYIEIMHKAGVSFPEDVNGMASALQV